MTCSQPPIASLRANTPKSELRRRQIWHSPVRLKLSRQNGKGGPGRPPHRNFLVAVRTVYLTSGRTRKLRLGKQVIELQHAPSWQLTLAKEPAGEIVRALAWAGPERAQKILKEIERKVPRSELQKLNQHLSLFPTWLIRVLCRNDNDAATMRV
jgi:hypothetical protein